MFNVKFETKEYKYYLKMGGWVDGREVCLSSNNPEDDDIKNIVERALEAYHKYQGDKLQHYMGHYYIPGDVNAKDDKQCESENKTNEFQIDQKVIIVSGPFNLERGVIVGFDGDKIIVKMSKFNNTFSKKDIHIDDIDDKIKRDVEIIFNGEYAIMRGVKIISGKLCFDISVDDKWKTISKDQLLVFAEIDKSECGTFVQINKSGLYCDEWYGYIRHRIVQLDSYVVHINYNSLDILINSKDVIEIDIKYNKNSEIIVNDVVKTVEDTRMLFSYRYGIVRCHSGEEYYIDFGNALHHYKKYKFVKVTKSK